MSVTLIIVAITCVVSFVAFSNAKLLDRLILWDPIVDGPAYVKELKVEHMEALELSFYAKDKSWFRAHPERDTAPLTEAIG